MAKRGRIMDILCSYKKRELREILCYPWPSEECFIRRLVEARLLGIRYFVKSGRHKVKGIPIVGKGTTALVLAAEYLGGLKVAVKVRRIDANRRSLLSEAEILRLANRQGAGPPLIAASRNMVLWRFIDGKPFYEWLKSTDNVYEVKNVLRKLLIQLYSLDKAGIAHNELSRPGEHILVEGGSPYVIDFESATLNSRRSNVTQFLSILIREDYLSAKLRNMLKIDKNNIINALREYKDQRNIAKLLNTLRL